MTSRKSSLPTPNNDFTLSSTTTSKFHESAALKNFWKGAKKRLTSSCSKIAEQFFEHDDDKYSKCHSFPGSTIGLLQVTGTNMENPSSNSSSKSNSSLSISDTLLKVRRLTHVYDHDESLLSFVKSKESNNPVEIMSPAIECEEKQNFDLHSPEEVEKIARDIYQKPSAKFGEKSYKLPTKAAAVLGADDLLIHQSFNEQISPKIQHALFLEKSEKVKRINQAPEHDQQEFYCRNSKTKKKSGLGIEVREKLASLWKPLDQSGVMSTGHPNAPMSTYSPNLAGGLQLKDMEKLVRAGKATLEQVKSWSNSFENLLHDKYGLALFHDFLRSEFSDENIEFWIACEEYRTICQNKKLQTRAEKIYNDFVGVQAAREVNLDSKTRQQTEIDIRNPTPHTFDQAQKRIQALMEKDSYQRFLRSELYARLLRSCNEYQQQLQKTTKEQPIKGPTISSLGITAQDLSKLTMTASKVALIPHSSTVHKTQRNNVESKKCTVVALLPQNLEMNQISTVQPDEPSLPFSKNSLIFSPENNK